MNLSFDVFVGLVALWLCLCALCGFRRRLVLFLALVFFGVASNSIWLSAALKVAPLEPLALNAQAAGLACAVMAFVIGFFFSRLQSAWRDSSVENASLKDRGV